MSCPLGYTSDKEPPGAEGSPAAEPSEPSGLSRERGVSGIPQVDGELWPYPSPAQFHSATLAKGHSINKEKIPLIVDIHNAVNEEAWRRILAWERKNHPDCLDTRLIRFVGRPGDRSPTSLFNEYFRGRLPPFDRHDWLIDRCGREHVRYVVDFYDGKLEEGMVGVPICVDARPALDSLGAFIDRLKSCFS